MLHSRVLIVAYIAVKKVLHMCFVSEALDGMIAQMSLAATARLEDGANHKLIYVVHVKDVISFK